MAVRILALLIPLAITLPQLQVTPPVAPAAQELAAPVQPVAQQPWSYETRRVADVAMTRVLLESPLEGAVRTLDNALPDAADSAAAPDAMPQVRKASPRRAAAKVARAALPAKVVSAPAGPATRQSRRVSADTACLPSVHCAPVVVARVTLVARRPL